MDAVLDIAGRHNLAVVEDCAHALGAAYRGRPVGTFGDGAFFSFQSIEPLNCYGGGLAVVRDAAVADRVRRQVGALPWPDDKRIANRLFIGRLQRIFTRPRVFSVTGFPVLWAASFARWRPDASLWKRARPLTPLPEDYLERFSNVQAALGLAGLDLLDAWTAATRSHAHAMTSALGGLAGVRLPAEPPDRTHVYHQSCIRTPSRDRVVRDCIRRGVDVDMLPVNVFAEQDRPGRRAA